ncbi:uncharacterized mitochondrial protein AtMg00810-like [Humulus lupulus]|uniref:uncharacterized mitochondrial protein AtMg00810-like n=1 Tax=Humulus lupulus TaxID=3486 RepID=UPI002B403F29|nr:uncharacterized mitochondrial protein AtMg00810-like [Humulus lupulus]
MTDLGPLSYFLDISIHRSFTTMFLSQRQDAQEILSRANMSSCKSALTPVDTQSKLSASSGPPMKDPTLYRQLSRAVQYLTFTRPNISYVVQQVCLFMHNPHEQHFHTLRRILCYIKGTIEFGMHLTSSPATGLVSYMDADWGGCSDTRRSTFGYCIFLSDNLVS